MSVCVWGGWGLAVTWQGLGPPDDPQQLPLAQPVEAVEEQVWHVRLGVVEAGVHRLRLDVLQDARDLGGEVHLADARQAGHGAQGLVAVGRHGQVRLEHQGGRRHAQRLQGPETLQLPACGGAGGELSAGSMRRLSEVKSILFV